MAGADDGNSGHVLIGNMADLERRGTGRTCRVGWSNATVAGSWTPSRACTRARSSTAPSESRPACGAQQRCQIA